MNELTIYYLYFAALLFSAGTFVVLTKRNVIFVLIGVELILNASNILLAAFSQGDETMKGQIFAIFSVALTVCEVAIAMGIQLNLYRKFKVSNLDELSELTNK